MLTVVPAGLLLVACGAPEAVPVAPAAAVSPATAARTAATTQPLGVVPVDMGPTPAQEVAARVAAQTGNPPPRQVAPKPAPQRAAQPAAPKPPAAASASGCNANYTPCVPNDSDVDCQGGSGNGPSYKARCR
jgi:hypothetical protein